MTAKPEFTIDAELASLCPEYVGEDAEGLAASILSHGVREPLVLWREERLLLDGHLRLAICTQHGKSFPTTEYSFPDRRAARDAELDASDAGRS